MDQTEPYPSGVAGPGRAPERAVEARRLVRALGALHRDPDWVDRPAPAEPDAADPGRPAGGESEIDVLTALEQRVDALSRRADARSGAVSLAVPLRPSGSIQALVRALAAELDAPVERDAPSQPPPRHEASAVERAAAFPGPRMPPPAVPPPVVIAPATASPATASPAAAPTTPAAPSPAPTPAATTMAGRTADAAAPAAGPAVPPLVAPAASLAAFPAAKPKDGPAAPPAAPQPTAAATGLAVPPTALGTAEPPTPLLAAATADPPAARTAAPQTPPLATPPVATPPLATPPPAIPPLAGPTAREAARLAQPARAARRRISGTTITLWSASVLLLGGVVLYFALGPGAVVQRPRPQAATPHDQSAHTAAASGPDHRPQEIAPAPSQPASGARAPQAPRTAGAIVPAPRHAAADDAGKGPEPRLDRTAADAGTTTPVLAARPEPTPPTAPQPNPVPPAGSGTPMNAGSPPALAAVGPTAAGMGAPRASGPEANNRVPRTEAAAPAASIPALSARPTPAPATGATASPPAPALPAATVVVRATANVWIGASTRAGAMVTSRLLHAGETWTPPRPDLFLTTGNAGGTELVMNGVAGPPLGRSGAVRRGIPLDPSRQDDRRPRPALRQRR